jgi:hypothetical protein
VIPQVAIFDMATEFGVGILQRDFPGHV